MTTLLLLALLAPPRVGLPVTTPRLEWCSGGTCRGGLTLQGDLNMAAYNIIGPTWIYRTARTTDATPYLLSVMAGNAWAQATGASRTGASLALDGGIGTRQVTCSAFGADAADDTYVLTIGDSPTTAGTATTLTAKNGGAAGDQWNCDTSNANCCLNLKTLVNSKALSVVASCIDGTCSDGKVYLTPTAGTTYSFSHTITNNAGAVFGSATSGTDGRVVIKPGSTDAFLALGCTTSACPALRRTSTTLTVRLADDSGNANIGAAQIAATVAGDAAVQTQGSSGGARLGTGGRFSWSDNANGGLGTTDTTIRRSAAGEVGIGNNTVEYGRLKEVRLNGAGVTVDASSAADQTIYTVPAGKTAYVTKIIARDPSAAITNTTAGIGWNAGTCTNVMGANAVYNNLSGASSYIHLNLASTGAVRGAATNVLCWKTTVQEAAADTIVIDVYGIVE